MENNQICHNPLEKQVFVYLFPQVWPKEVLVLEVSRNKLSSYVKHILEFWKTFTEHIYELYKIKKMNIHIYCLTLGLYYISHISRVFGEGKRKEKFC